MNLSKPKLSFQFTLGVTWSNICLTKPRLEPYEKGATLLPLWCDPFIVPEEDGNHQSSHLVMVACTMFNAALEYHVRALRQPNDDNRADEHIARVVDSMRNYSTALKMYRQCLQILRNGHQIKACSSTSQWVIFKIALINNIGHCCAHLGMYATSENFYQELSSTLWLILHGCRHRCSENLVRIAKRFLLTTQILASPSIFHLGVVELAPAA
mmetsp:Transcript_31094/g.89901  ORF Transcript_31094/g.89901 Transcript_31094/m.89901 type:complete len:212 (+) Transcript_31094:351-986(+)